MQTMAAEHASQQASATEKLQAATGEAATHRARVDAAAQQAAASQQQATQSQGELAELKQRLERLQKVCVH